MLAGFDDGDPTAVARLMRPCCASDAWIEALLAARPVNTLAELNRISDDVLASVPWPQIEQALAAHPRIGERRSGEDRESAWSREEQASTAATGESRTQQRIAAGNRDYEHRFGWVFLIRAAGRSADEVLAELQRRLTHETIAEQKVVRHELAEIVRLRLARTFGASVNDAHERRATP